MHQKKTYGLVGLASYLLIALLLLINTKLQIKWLWHDENLFDWLCMFLAILAHTIIVVGFIKLLWYKNWNQKAWAIIDAIFFAATITYILFWLMLWAIASSFTFDHPY